MFYTSGLCDMTPSVLCLRHQVGVATVLALSEAPALVKLSLFSCPLAERGVVALASQLSKGGFPSLRELVVSGCGVTLIAAEALMQALASGSGQCLKVSHCGQCFHPDASEASGHSISVHIFHTPL